MSALSSQSAASPLFRFWKVVPVLALLLLAVGALTLFARRPATTSVLRAAAEAQPTATPGETQRNEKPATESGVELAEESWAAAGIELAPVASESLQQVVRVTGKITLNEDRVAHIAPLVAGRVQAVHVRLGQNVDAGQSLVTVESPEIGSAKLDLYRNRLLSDIARVKDEWTQEISRNTHQLVERLRTNPSTEELASGFAEKKLGKNREQLIAAYTSLKKASLDRERQETLARQGITPGKELIAAKALHEAELATFQALLETIDQEELYNALLSTQARQEADNRVAVDEASLKVLGFSDKDLANVDPIKEGKALSRYEITAPFAGTLIAKDVALLERVSPEHEFLTLADLSTVWVKVDVFEQHLPLLSNLDGGVVDVVTSAWPGEVFKARVIHTGEIVDEASRTIGMRAAADNADGRLKPGMFVEVTLRGRPRPATAVVPVSAIQEHQGRQFIFVHTGGERFEVRDVKLGQLEGDRREVTAGLKPGDKIVAKGGFALKSRMLADLLSGD